MKRTTLLLFLLLCLNAITLQVRSFSIPPPKNAAPARRSSFLRSSQMMMMMAQNSSNNQQRQRQRRNNNNTKRRAIPDNVRILILPGFGNDSKDYFLERAPQGSLVASLEKRGWHPQQIKVLPVARMDWLQVFWKGMLDYQFWLAKAAPTRPAFQWYLQRIAETLQELTTANDDDDENNNNNVKVVLLGHSAGGWLARACLGFGSSATTTTAATTEEEEEERSSSSSSSSSPFVVNLDRILGLVTLGAPHLPPPPSVMDMTRGALRLTHENFPGAYHAPDGLFYVTVIGNAVQGVQQKREKLQSLLEPTSVTGFAFNSYEAVCGNGTTVGDGVVPVSAGHLDDATQVNLDGIFHSINAPDQWYGSDAVLDSWHDVLLDEIEKQQTSRKRTTTPNLFENLFR